MCGNRNCRKRVKLESEDLSVMKKGEKRDLEVICYVVKKFSEVFGWVDCYGFEVLCIWLVCEFCGKIRF